MNESLKQFQSIQTSVKLLLNNEQESVEIQTSAIKLKDSVGICLQEMRESAEKLQLLITNCYEDLKEAEDTWNSKARILAVPQAEIWEQIAQLTAIDVRIRQLQEHCLTEVIQEIANSWEECFESLKAKWFIDAKSGNLKGNIGLSDKDGLIKELKLNFNIKNKEASQNVNTYLEKLYQELDINLELIKSYINCLNIKNQKIFITLVVEGTYKRNSLRTSINSYYSPFGSGLDDFINSGLIVITWPQFYDFAKKVKAHIKESVSSRFNNNFKLSLEIIEQAINFYTSFLELQNRYQQETPEQREAEKKWIEEQRQKLETVQSEITRFLIMLKLGLRN